VTGGDQFVDFDEAELRERLAGLRESHQRAFVASCIERAAPTYLSFAEIAYLEESASLVRQVVEATWRGCTDPKRGITERSIANELWHLARTNWDPAVTLGQYAEDCVTALYFGADFQLTGDLKAASESARWIYNALDALVSNRSGKQAGTSDEFRQLRSDPGLQRELRKENTDLTMLESAPELTPELLDVIRTDSSRLGKLMLGDFESEAQSRLRRS
jgi:hypothetical protein